jgi:3-deoxy-D-manno-octulosonic-acid transferase
MRWLVDAIYLVIGALTSPFWLWRMGRAGKLRTDWKGRFGGGAALPPSSRKTLLIHAVSVGEVNAIRRLVERLADDESQPRIVIAGTTDTGVARARELFASAHEVVRYPLDLNFAVRRFLKRINPDAVALVELELWPHFTAECQRRNIPICVVNGRLSARSFRRYQWIGPIIRRSFQRLAFAAVQNPEYAERFEAMGVPRDRI